MVKRGLQSGSRIRENPQKIIVVNDELCHLCGACVAICIPDALFLSDMYLEVKNTCTGCERCAKICPMHALSVAERKTP
jgi:MinD superfamily P-loop ATPase